MGMVCEFEQHFNDFSPCSQGIGLLFPVDQKTGAEQAAAPTKNVSSAPASLPGRTEIWQPEV